MKTIQLTVYEITEIENAAARGRAFDTVRAEIIEALCDETIADTKAFARDLDWAFYQPADLRAAAENRAGSLAYSAAERVLKDWEGRGDTAESVTAVRAALLESAYQGAREWSEYPSSAAPDDTVIEYCAANAYFFTAGGALFSEYL